MTLAGPVEEDRGGLAVLAWPSLAELGAEVVVTTRQGGVSEGPYESLNLATHVGDDPGAVAENRRRVARALGVEVDDLAFATQVHGRRAHVVAPRPPRTVVEGLSGGPPAGGPQADILVTAAVGPVLAIVVADCMPVALFDPVAGVLGCAHAGWRGAVAGVAAAAVEAMEALGAHAADMVAVCGPAVDAGTYQVGDEVAQAAHRAFPPPGPPGGAPVVRPDGTGRWLFDLWATNGRVLAEAGVRADRTGAVRCTTGPPGPFFSHRAEGPCGRVAMLARILPPRPPREPEGGGGGGP